MPRVRKVAQANSRSRVRVRASCRASSSRADVRWTPTSTCSETSRRLRRTSCWGGCPAPRLGEIERALEDGGEGRDEVVVLGRDALELLAVGLERLGHDLVEAVELGLEVVVQRGRADADRGGDVGPLAVLVALTAEQLGGDVEDRRALAARRRPPGAAAACGLRLAWLRHVGSPPS